MTLSMLDDFAQIPAADWDAMAGNIAGLRPVDPFTTHRFLTALERSGSTGTGLGAGIGGGTGWQNRSLILRTETGSAAMPLYAKSHSQGEYIFDHGWAEAYQRAGGRYYPKLQSAVPFTPASGRRFLGNDAARSDLLDAAIDLVDGNGLSSLHITFCTEDEALALSGRRGVLHRVTQQFHWENRGYRDFQDFLSGLAARKRKNIRKEREVAQGHGLRIEALTGAAIQPEHWDAFWQFYQDTGGRKWGTPYLTRRFFSEIHDTMRADILLILAFDGTRAVAGALNFIARHTLYGRYWGCVRDYPCLHFELCYYQAIDWAIAQGLTRVEAGAQGEHKLARGYLPSPVHSLHYLREPPFRDAVAQYLTAERRAVAEEIDVLTAYGPFKRGQDLE